MPNYFYSVLLIHYREHMLTPACIAQVVDLKRTNPQIKAVILKHFSEKDAYTNKIECKCIFMYLYTYECVG